MYYHWHRPRPNRPPIAFHRKQNQHYNFTIYAFAVYLTNRNYPHALCVCRSTATATYRRSFPIHSAHYSHSIPFPVCLSVYLSLWLKSGTMCKQNGNRAGKWSKRCYLSCIPLRAPQYKWMQRHNKIEWNLPVDSTVHGDHDETRYPKANRTGNDGIRFVHNKYTLVGVQALPIQRLFGRVPAEKNRCKRDECGQQPNVGQHEEYGPICHVQWILQWPNDRIISKQMEKVRN